MASGNFARPKKPMRGASRLAKRDSSQVGECGRKKFRDGIKLDVCESKTDWEPYTLGMELIRAKACERGESVGKAELYVNDKAVDQDPMKTPSPASSRGLCVGCDSGDAVSEDLTTSGGIEGGAIQAAGVPVEKKQYLDLERLASVALALDGPARVPGVARAPGLAQVRRRSRR